MRKPRLSKEELERMYTHERMSSYKIGRRLGVTNTTVFNWLKKHGIETRDSSEARLLKGVTKPTKEELKTMYVDGRMSARDIGKRLGVNGMSVLRWVRDYNIEIRDNSEAQLPEGFTKPSKEELERMYLDERMSTVKIEKKLGVSDAAVLNWLKGYGIETRDRSEALLPNGFTKPTKEELQRMYVDERMGVRKIGKKIGVCNSTVLKFLKEYKIKIREPKKLPKGFVKPSSEELRRMYFEERMNSMEIGKKIGVYNSTVLRWLREYEIPIRNNNISNSQFKDFLKDNQPALNLAGASVILNGQGSDAEKIIIELYQGKFKNLQQLHALINENKEDIYKIIEEGLTNLGTYIGNYTLNDRTIIPILIGQAISGISDNKVTSSLEEKVVRIFRAQYSPSFNDNPKEILSRLEKTIGQYNGKTRDIYQRLYNHYREVLQLQEELS